MSTDNVVAAAAVAAPAAAVAAAPLNEDVDFVSYGTDVTDDAAFADVMAYFRKIVSTDPITDALQEEYLDLAACGMFADQNIVKSITARKGLWETHPELKGRLVIFGCARPLLAKTLSALQRGAETVLITGTPGIGKSSLRNVHVHLLFERARNANKRCSIIMAKGENDTVIRLHRSADGSLHVEDINAYVPKPSLCWDFTSKNCRTCVPVSLP